MTVICIAPVSKSILTKTYIFEERLKKLRENYENNYKTLKDNLGIPNGDDFDFGFVYENETIIGLEEKNITRNVFVVETSLHYINKNADINAGTLKVKIW